MLECDDDYILYPRLNTAIVVCQCVFLFIEFIAPVISAFCLTVESYLGLGIALTCGLHTVCCLIALIKLLRGQ
jgi:hypothetical protein